LKIGWDFADLHVELDLQRTVFGSPGWSWAPVKHGTARYARTY
jgi:hypothetical protein